MDISVRNVDSLNAVLKMKICHEDYKDQVNKSLRKMTKTVNIKGFRQGMVPVNILQKMYGKHVLTDEINKLVNENLGEYIKTNKILILGEPLSSIVEPSQMDFETNQTDFELNFDLGLVPDVDISKEILSDVTFYNVQMNETEIANLLNRIQKAKGKNIEIEAIETEAKVTACLEEINEDTSLKENGIKNEEAVFLFDFIKDEEIKNFLLGKKNEDFAFLNLKKAFPEDAELALLLKVKKEEITEIGNLFKMTIKKIEKIAPAEMNKELYREVLGMEESEEITHEDFVNKIKEDHTAYYNYIATEELTLEIVKKLMTMDIELSEEFLKRWLFIANQGKIAKEKIEEDFPHYKPELKKKVIMLTFLKKYDMKISEKEIKDKAIEMVIDEYRSMGLDVRALPYEYVKKTATERLEGKDGDSYVDFYKDKIILDRATSILIHEGCFNRLEISVDEYIKMTNEKRMANQVEPAL